MSQRIALQTCLCHGRSLYQQRCSQDGSQPIADVDLLKMYGRRQDIEATLQAMGLDHARLPEKCDPGYRHKSPSDPELIQKAHSDP